MKRPEGKRLGDLLVAADAISRERVEALAARGVEERRLLGELLLATNEVEEREVYRQLAAQRAIPFTSAAELLPVADPDLWRGVPLPFLERHRVLPICRIESSAVVATCEPDLEVPELAAALGVRTLDLRLVTPTDLRRLRVAFELELALASRLPVAGLVASRGGGVGDLLAAERSLDPELVGLFNALLLEAIGERASDIHLEQYGDRVRVRIRVDGDLLDAPHFRLSPEKLRGLVNVLKVKAGLDIAERRAPQGGRFTTRSGDHVFDLRVQTQPAMHGEHAVIRLLPQDTGVLTIEELGFPKPIAAAYDRLLDSPAGLILVVGPTGSGKSTTLYAGLQVLARDRTRKVITVEDPIEYALDGVQQTQVNPAVGFGFAGAMRAFVRQDPDVILVGEIRDGETALEALRASQTGHLVLSTLHCNDTVDAVQRLLDLGMHPNSIASELMAVFSQRLAKRICPHCRVPAEPDPARIAEVYGDAPPPGASFFRGEGCVRCGGLGTHGRIAVVEHLPVGPDMRRAIAHRLPLDELRQVARGSGLAPLRDQALALVHAGRIEFESLPEMLTPEMLAGG